MHEERSSLRLLATRLFQQWELQAVTVAAFAIVAIAAHGRNTLFCHYTMLANALLHGHWYVGEKWWVPPPASAYPNYAYQGPPSGDFFLNGHFWVVEPPFPALLMIPLVLVEGTSANETFGAELVGTACVALTWILLKRLGLPQSARLWLTAFTLIGTDVWWCAELGDVWYLAHLTAFALTMGILIEMTGENRAWLIALLSVFAFESRATMMLAVPLYLYLSRNRWQMLPIYALGAIAFVAINEAEWGTWYNHGYVDFFHFEPWGEPTGSPFGLQYIPYQLFSFFMRTPTLVTLKTAAHWPIFNVDYMGGTALTWTSPALMLAFLATSSSPRPFPVRWLWATVLLIFIPNVTYYSNGFEQAGMRHALDFEPFLIAMMALGVRDGIPRWGQALITWSVVFGIWQVWWWNVYMRPDF